MRDYQLPASDAETFKNNMRLGDYFEHLARQSKHPKAVANWVINNLRAKLAARRIADELLESEYPTNVDQAVERAILEPTKGSALANLKFKPESLLELVSLVEAKIISSSAAQQVFAEMFATGESPSSIVEKKGLAQVSDTGAIENFCDKVISTHPGPVSDFKSGKGAALNFLKGQVMKLSKGKANPALVGEVLEQKLKG
jgi:aspartyl-tRNA(Asn)/glutamyl-tRNA(Gln) amidotransferase subunit B